MVSLGLWLRSSCDFPSVKLDVQFLFMFLLNVECQAYRRKFTKIIQCSSSFRKLRSSIQPWQNFSLLLHSVRNLYYFRREKCLQFPAHRCILKVEISNFKHSSGLLLYTTISLFREFCGSLEYLISVYSSVLNCVVNANDCTRNLAVL